MKLTTKQIDEIYDLHSWSLSQRYIAKRTGRGRGTISMYLKPISIIEHFHTKEYELEEKISNYRNLALFSLSLVTIQTLITIFY